MIFTTKKCYNFGLSSGKIPLSHFNARFSTFVQNLFGLNKLNNINKYKGLEKMEGHLKVIRKETQNFKNA